MLRVISSVSRNVSSLVMVVILTLIVVYNFTMIGFAFFRGEYSDGQCSSLHHCFTISTHLHLPALRSPVCSAHPRSRRWC
jgi:hypothetical protein